MDTAAATAVAAIPSSSTSSTIFTTAIRRILEEETIAALITLIEAPHEVGTKLLVGESGEQIAGGFGDGRLNTELCMYTALFLRTSAEAQALKVEEFASDLEEWRGARVLFERVAPEPHIVICGAGHVGAALARLTNVVGYRTTIIDDRAEFVTRTHFPEERINLIAAESWSEMVRKSVGMGRGVFVVVVTRGHSEDEECLRATFVGQPDYVGLIGSKRRTNIVLNRLREAKVDESKLKEVRAPVGLNIAAVTPEEVALAILAEIVMVRRGGTGTSLSAWRR